MKLRILILGMVVAASFTTYGNDKVKSLYDEARAYLFTNPDSAKIIANELYGVSVKADNIYGLVRSQYLLGWISQNIDGNYGRGLIHHLEAIRFSELGDYEQKPKDVHGVFQNLAYIYQVFGDNSSASNYYKKCIELATDVDDNNLLLSSLRALYRHYDELEDYENALKVIEEFEQINSIVGNKEMLLDGLNAKGYILKELNRYEDALKCYDDLINTINRFGSEEFIVEHSLALTNSAECQYLSGNYKVAQNLYDQSLELKRKISNLIQSNPRSYFYSLQGIAVVNMEISSFSKAEQSFKKAEDFLNSIPELSDNLYFEFYIKFADFYEQNGYFEKANSYRKIHSDKLAEHWKKQQEIELIDKQYNLELITQRYYSLLRQQERNERIQKYGAVSIITLVLIFVGVVLSGRIQRYRLKKDLERSIRIIQES